MGTKKKFNRDAYRTRTPEEKQNRRRVENQVCSYLRLSKDEILEILDKHKIKTLSSAKVKRWENDINEAPDYMKELLDMSRHREEDILIHKELAKDRRKFEQEQTSIRAYEKAKTKNPKLTWEEEVCLADDVLFFGKVIVGMKPEEVLEVYGEDESAQTLCKHFGIKMNDHRTYPVHGGGCDTQGKDYTCEERIDEIKREEQEHRRYIAGMKEIEILTGDISVGDYVVFFFDSKIGKVEKVNKVSYTIEGIGNNANLGDFKNYRTNPAWAKKTDIGDFPVYKIGEEILVVCLDGHKRNVTIVDKKDKIFYKVEYVVKSRRETVQCWIDPLRFIEED